MKGRIIRGIAGFYYVWTETDEVYACRARGIFRKTGIKPLVGDEVLIRITDEKDREGNVEEILPRKSELIRPALANVDQAAVIFSVKSPDPHLKKQSIPTIVCFNKKDLAQKEELLRFREYTESFGIRTVFTCGKTGEGTEELRTLLKNKTTTLAGASGVGKSTIMNCLSPDAHMETGEISRKIERGKHTTRHAELICLEKDTYLADTPGFGSLVLPDIAKEELRDYYPEFAPYEKECRFQMCSHTQEKECGVIRAVREKKISEERYRNYVSFYEELKERKSYE